MQQTFSEENFKTEVGKLWNNNNDEELKQLINETNKKHGIDPFQAVYEICKNDLKRFLAVWPFSFEIKEIEQILNRGGIDNDTINLLLNNIDKKEKISEILSMVNEKNLTLSIENVKNILGDHKTIASSDLLNLYNKVADKKGKNLFDIVDRFLNKNKKICPDIIIGDENYTNLLTTLGISTENKITDTKKLHHLLCLIKSNNDANVWDEFKALIDNNIELNFEAYKLIYEKFPCLENITTFEPRIDINTINGNGQQIFDSIQKTSCKYSIKQSMFRYIINVIKHEKPKQLNGKLNYHNAQLCLIGQDNFKDRGNGFLKYVAYGGAKGIISNGTIQQSLNILCAIAEKLIIYLKDPTRGWWQNHRLKSKVLDGIPSRYRNFLNHMVDYFLPLNLMPTPYIFYLSCHYSSSNLTKNFFSDIDWRNSNILLRGHVEGEYLYFNKQAAANLLNDFPVSTINRQEPTQYI